ncbi:MAG: hypothetical protein K2J37_03400, partial [Ruminococcus sp.]|nr:hypothetical protein [Ruminococcus sp.]
MNLKKIISTFTAFIIAAGTSALNVNAEADNGFTQTEISDSRIKPYISLTKQVLSRDELSSGHKVNVQVIVDTEDYSYAAAGLHIYYDPRLEIETDYDGRINVKRGYAAKDLSLSVFNDSTAEDYGMKGIFISTAGDDNSGTSGVLAEFTFNLPNNVHDGDVYPLDIVYKESSKVKDTFTTFNDNLTGRLMQAWAFTKGIYNNDTNYNFTADFSHIQRCPALWDIDPSYDGYIAVGFPVVTTTTTAPTTTTTTIRYTTTTTRTTTTARPTTTTRTTTTSRTTNTARRP